MTKASNGRKGRRSATEPKPKPNQDKSIQLIAQSATGQTRLFKSAALPNPEMIENELARGAVVVAMVSHQGFVFTYTSEPPKIVRPN